VSKNIGDQLQLPHVWSMCFRDRLRRELTNMPSGSLWR